MLADSQTVIGRRQELGHLQRALSRVTGGRPAWLALTGEPGIGKTALLSELERRAEAAGALVLTGRGVEFERDLPFGLWVDALDDHVGALGPEALARLLGDQVGERARVLPAAGRPSAAAAIGDERFLAHRAVRTLLMRWAVGRPVLVVLDDLQWGDEASLELVAHLLRRPPRSPLLLALAYRAGQLPAGVAAALEATRRDVGLVELPLAPLNEQEARELLGDAVTDAESIYRESGGNPFYLEQLAHVAASGGRAGLPGGVAAALEQEIGGLGPVARSLAMGAAVAGEPADLELAAATAGMPEADAPVAVDELLRRDLLRPADVPRRYRFRHPIVRHAVYDAAGEAWRLEAHGRAAAALADRGAPLAARAHHLERCAAVGDAEAVGVLTQAGHAALGRAPASAAGWFEAALRLLGADADGGARLGLLVPLATALASTGRLERALAALEEALGLIPPALAEIRVAGVAASAACENLRGRHDAAHARLVSALDDAPDAGSAAAAALHVELAADALYEGEFEPMLDRAREASRVAAALPAPAVGATAAALECFALYGLGRMPEAQAARERAAAAVDGLDDGALALRPDAPYYLGFAAFFCERYDDAIRHCERGIAVARATGQGQFLVPTMVGLAHALEMRGRLTEAIDVAERAVDAARSAGNRQVVAWALIAHAWAAAQAGGLDAARAAGEEAVALLEGLDDSVLTRATREHVTAVWLEIGDPARALSAADDAGAPGFSRIEPGRRAWLCALLGRAELELGDHAAAADWVTSAAGQARDLGLPLTDATILHTRALLELAGGDAAEAAALAERAAARADEVGAVIPAARARVLAGRALAAAGDRAGAVERLTRAEAELAACGAERFRDEAGRELRRLGKASASRQRRGSGTTGAIDALSGREREIAELVADGLTNREIAGRLFLSGKTVEGHLTNVFAKLGVSSRAGVAEAVGRERAAASSG